MANEVNTGGSKDNGLLGGLLKLLVVYAGGKIIHNAVTDNKREPILQYLPLQNLNWLENSSMRGFFRDHSFYVTQFPITPSGDFGNAVRILYWTLKYLGAVELQKNFVSWHARNTLGWMCSSRNMDEIDALKGQTLEDVLHAGVFRRLFSLPPNKRIDVEIYDPKPDPIQLIQDLREELWSIGQLYPYLDNSKYLLHIYDLGEYQLTHFLPTTHPWYTELEKQNGAMRVLWQIRHLDQLGENQPNLRFIGLPKSAYYKNKNPEFHNPRGRGEVWDGFGKNVAFARYVLKFKGRSELKGLIFSRSGEDSEDLMFISHGNLQSVFEDTTLTNEAYKGREYDAERKILLALYQYFKDDWINLQKIELELYTEDIPCESCTPILKKFHKDKQMDGKVSSFKVYYIESKGRNIATVREDIFNGSTQYHFTKDKRFGN
jgi:hypothetical protein